MSGRQSIVHRLPRELLCCILASSSDLGSLTAAVLSCRTFYSLFERSKESLIKSVLINRIGVEVLPEAIFTYEFCLPYLEFSFDDLEEEDISQMVQDVSKFLYPLTRPTLTSATWTMEEALAIESFHTSVVDPLTQKFIQSCAASSIFPLGESLSARPVSHLEKQRIIRALYRFELFRKLFGNWFFSEPNDQDFFRDFAAKFCSHFAPWEIVQLGCIHDFLHGEVMTGMHTLHILVKLATIY